MENYICFYTINPFWAGEKPDIDNLISNPDLFTETLSERTFKFENKYIYLAFCKDGLIMTRVKELESKRDLFITKSNNNEPLPLEVQFSSKYLEYLNAIQVILSSSLLKLKKNAYLKNSSIRSGEAFSMNFKGGKFASSVIPDNITESFYCGRYVSQYNTNYPIQIDRRITSRPSLEYNVFELCFDDLNLIIDNHEAIQMLSQTNSAISEYNNLNFKQALIQAWFVIEYYINKKWIDYLLSKQKNINTTKNRIDSERQKFLLGSDFTSSIKSNLLELNDLISIDIFYKINIIRNKRNIAVHNLDLVEKLADIIQIKSGKKKDKRISTDNCRDAFLVIIDFFKSEYKIDLRISEGFSFSNL